MVPAVPPGCQPVSADDKVSELSEDDVTVSYIGDELDLKTVGDIIAIIEDKVQKDKHFYIFLQYLRSVVESSYNAPILKGQFPSKSKIQLFPLVCGGISPSR